MSKMPETITTDDGSAVTVEIPEELEARQTGRFREIVAILLKSEMAKGPTPARVRMLIEQLGPTYVKIGQIMSMRPDMIPREYCDELAKLRTDVEPLPYPTVQAVLTETFGTKLESTFKHIDEKPLGSASIAQAHKAQLKSGETVVLKVERPGIYQTMAEDIALLRHAAHALKIVAGDGPLDLGTILDEMWVVAQEEMDFLVEAKHAEQFAQYNADEPRVSCPYIYDNLSTSKVLVMEFIDGISVGDTDKLDAAGVDREDLGEVLVSNYMKQILEDGFFHADPHPGNVWVRDNGIVWIDMGMMGHLSNKDRTLINNALVAVVTRDVSALKDVVLALGVYKGPIDHPKLYSDIDTYLTKYGALDMEGVDMGVALSELMDIAKGNGIAMPSSISMFTRGIATVEGTLQTLAPSLNLLEICASQIQESTLRNFSLRGFLTDKTRKLYASGSKAVELPGLATDLLRMTLRGRTKVNIDMRPSEDLTDLVRDTTDKVVGGLLVSAFLIGSSFLCTTGMNPKILGVPALGVIGFIVAIVLAVLIVCDMFSRRRKKR